MRSIMLFPLLLSCWLPAFCQFQNFESYYYPDSDLYMHEVVPTLDDGHLLIASRHCYIEGGGIAIEGCLFELYLIRIDALGDTLWTTTVPTDNSYFINVRTHALSDGTFSLLLSEPNTYTCAGYSIGLWGWDRTKGYRLSSTGEIIGEINYQEECLLGLEDALALQNDEQLVLLNYSDEPFGWMNSGRLMKIDSDNQPVWTVDFPTKAFNQGQILPLGPDKALLAFQREGEFLVAQATTDGEILWTVPIKESSSRFLRDAIRIGNQDLVLLIQNLFMDQLEVFRVDGETGTVEWETIIDHPQTGLLWSIPTGILIATTTTGPDEDEEVALIELSLDGDSLSTNILPGSSWERPKALFDFNGQLGIAGDIVCCGSPESFDPRGVFWSVSEYVFVNVSEPQQAEGLKVWPNPATSQLQVALPDRFGRQPGILQIFDATGRLVWDEKDFSGTVTVPTPGWSSGVYLVRFQQNDQVYIQKVLIGR